MNKRIPTFCLFFVLTAALGAIELRVQYPPENEIISAAAIDSNFIFGQVTPPTSQLIINGQPVTVYDNGSFLAWQPIQHGEFVYTCLAISGEDSLLLKRTVFYEPPLQSIQADSAVIDSTSLQPNTTLILRAGDIVTVSFRGTPGCSAFFNIDGLASTIPMLESTTVPPAYWGEAVFGQGKVLRPDPVAGVYHGLYHIQHSDSVTNAVFHFYLVHANGDTAHAQTAGVLSIDQERIPLIAETQLDLTVLRTGPRKSYYYFLPDKVKLQVTGKQGTNYRIKLSETEDAWIEDYKIRLMPPGTPLPHFYIRLVRTQDLGSKTRVTVYGDQRVPYRFVQSISPNQLKVILYGVTADTDWIRYDFDDPLIEEIQWEQNSIRVYTMTISFNQNHPWGYDTGFDQENNFYIDLKKTPNIPRRKRAGLKHLRILLDPGHEPDTGAVGPTGLAEKDANLLLAQVLAKKLERRGATVIFTRTGQGLSLLDRLKFAMRTDADLLLSLHHNAVPAGVNPFTSRGTSTYYYHPQSRELARLIHNELLKELELPDFGLYWDNLAMCRPTQMPAVLIEPAFMMHPEEEMQIRSDRYRDRCSDAIVKALLEYVHEYRQ